MTPADVDQRDALAASQEIVERAHAAEAWSPCCDARLRPHNGLLLSRECPLCGRRIKPGDEVRWA